MKRLWIALLLLAAVFAATLYSGAHIRHFAQGLTVTLEEVALQAESEDWPAALQAARRAAERWMDREELLHVLLRHGDMDAIQTGLEELLVLAEHQDAAACGVTARRLVTQLELLWEAEQLTLSNLF